MKMTQGNLVPRAFPFFKGKALGTRLDTRLHFDVESDFPRFLDSVLQRTDQIFQTKVDEEIVEQHTVVIDGAFASYTQVYPETTV